MHRHLRLRRRKEFDAVYEKGRVLANRLLVLRFLPNEFPHNRYGFTTSKRLGKAVVRNRVRRRLREGLRVLPTRAGWDVVISARVPAAQANFHELKAAITNLLVRANILSEGAPREEKQP